MINILTASVTNGLMGASVNAKLADTPMAVYQQAKLKGDDTTMKRALGYASDSLGDAKKSSEKTQEALAKASTEEHKQEKDEQQPPVKESSQQIVQKTDSQQSTNSSTASDKVEISKDDKSVQNATSSEVHSENRSEASNNSGNYTSDGNVTPTDLQPKLSITA